MLAGEVPVVVVVVVQEEVQVPLQEPPSACPSCYWYSWAFYPTQAMLIERLVFSDALNTRKDKK